MKPRIRIRFCDFHRRLPQSLDYFRALLGSRYALDEQSDPDFVLYSNYGRQHRQSRCVRIFYSMENERPDFCECDYAFTFDCIDDPRHYRLPYYLMHADLSAIAPRTRLTDAHLSEELQTRSQFCAFVHSNPFGNCRNRLFEKLSGYRPVVSGGRYRNNLGYQVDDKISFMRSFKFGFAFENDQYPGYTTEKLTDVFQAGAIPIYWGNERVSEEFNSAAMLNRHEFASDEALVQRVSEIDNDDRLWLEYRRQPCFVNDQLPEWLSDTQILTQFNTIFATRIQPVATRDGVLVQCARRYLSVPSASRHFRRLARHSVKGLRLATGI